MKIFTFKYPKNAITDILLCLLCVFAIILIFQFDRFSAGIVLTFNNDSDIIDFLSINGWEVDPLSEVKTFVDLPDKENSVFTDYNAVQLSQGFNLLPYLGKRLEKYSYSVINDSTADGFDTIYATVLTYNGQIVGADICCPALDGFIKGVVIR